MESSHAKTSQVVLQSHFGKMGIKSNPASLFAAALGAHHGRIPIAPRGGGPLSGCHGSIEELESGIPWSSQRESDLNLLERGFSCDRERLRQASIDERSAFLWWIAGLTTVADWIGSDEVFFDPERGLSREERRTSAQQAIETIGLCPPKIEKGISFQELFGLSDAQPNEMQLQARESIKGPGVYIIEAPMGIGKTEAALWAAYELLQKGNARGIYFALPTQATSNRIHIRVADFVRRIAPESVSSRLIHGNSWLMGNSGFDYRPASSGDRNQGEDARDGRDWFASAKRALLAPFGVGTVDQALLAVVAAKHFFVRRFALAGKVVIIDEVHSYDLYTGTLIDKLTEALSELGATVIILSATLSGERRSKTSQTFSRRHRHRSRNTALPTYHGEPRDGSNFELKSVPPEDREVSVEFQPAEVASVDAMEIAERGGVVLWISNTVNEAQNRFKDLSRRVDGRFPVGLLHSRFPFFRREKLEKEWMERLGKGDEKRCGSILVSTQIVEQSVDLDADMMISELAPTDMLLQRMGRLWRHDRGNRPVDKPRLIILEESASLEELRCMGKGEIEEALGRKAYVYSPDVLLSTLSVWSARTTVSIPSEIRLLIEETYKEKSDLPDAWKELREATLKRCKKLYGKALRSSNIWSMQLDDHEGTQTRLDELPTISLVLCRHAGDSKVISFLDGSEEPNPKGFSISLARAIHRNLVRIPRRLFQYKTIPTNEFLSDYVHGEHTCGYVAESGEITLDRLETDYALRWSLEAGVEFSKE